MQRFSRRLGIAALSTVLVAGAFGTTQAGIIPWLYDGIFGMNYGGYPMSYSAGYGPCGPSGCGVACSPCGQSPCSTGRCSSRTANYSGCEVACTPSCNETSNWKSDAAPKKAEVRTEIRSNSPGSAVPRENFVPPTGRERTFRDDDDTGTQNLKKPVTNGAGTGFGPTPAGAGANAGQLDDPTLDNGFSEPAIKVKPATPPKLNLPPEGEAARPLNLDNKATWTVSPTTASLRTTRPVVLRDAKIARRTTDVPTTPAAVSNSTSIAKK